MSIDIPQELIAQHHNVELSIDVFYVCTVPLLASIDVPIKYRCIIPLSSRSAEELFRAVKLILVHYNKAGFLIRTIHANPEFQFLKAKAEANLSVTVNLTAQGDHVPTIERSNRVMGE